MKMIEGMNVIQKTDDNLYAYLFDFVDEWKIDIVDFMEKNYMNELSIQEMAYYSRRSGSFFSEPYCYSYVSGKSQGSLICSYRREFIHIEIISVGVSIT